jgi:tRNA threonylcarbamoyladenosine biosynthesis protein TsaE
MQTSSFEETYNFGLDFAKKLHGGEVIGLSGDLGSGKTTFAKGLAEGLKVADTINSPTFVILKTYKGKIGSKNIKLVHVDAYRAENIEDIKSVGIEDFLGDNDTVVVVEWAEKIKEILPTKTIFINFKHKSEQKREIEVRK